MPEISFTNEPLDLNILPKYENIPLKKPDQSYWKVILLNFFLAFICYGLCIWLAIKFIDDFTPFSTQIVVTYLISAFIILALYRISFSKRGYAIRTHDVIYKSGVIAESTTIIPLNRIQHIELNEKLFSRFFGLGSLQIFSAGGPSGHMKITGVPIEDAKIIRDVLLKKIESIRDTTTEPVV